MWIGMYADIEIGVYELDTQQMVIGSPCLTHTKNQLVQSKRFLVKTYQIRLWLIVYQKLYGYQLTLLHSEELASP